MGVGEPSFENDSSALYSKSCHRGGESGQEGQWWLGWEAGVRTGAGQVLPGGENTGRYWAMHTPESYRRRVDRTL